MMSEQDDRSPQPPVVVNGRIEEPLSRWLWLVKWFLLIPHYLVLAFLWLAFVVVTLVAFFAILFTGRYPHALFHFNLGVLRWSWRVSYYGYSALGTDRYPPFSLGEEPDYPATLDIAYPQRLSRGLVLVKSWLLAIPHYVVLGFVLGGATWTITSATGTTTSWTTASGGGLLGALVLIAAVALLFTARYPRGLYEFAMGLDRWVLRVAAYAALMTDAYPPFRLDQGGADPAWPSRPPTSGAPGSVVAEPAGPPVTPTAPMTPMAAPNAPQTRTRSTTGSVVALVAGIVVVLLGLGVAAVGSGGLWLESRRDSAGYITTTTQTLSSSTAAVTVENVNLRLGAAAESWVQEGRFGTVRIRAISTDGGPIFVGVAPQSAVDAWLAGVAHDEVLNIVGGTVRYRHHDGNAVAPSPTQQAFWSAAVAGRGTQQLQWKIANGRWALVLSRPAGTPGVRVIADVGATVPGLTALSVGLLVVGIILVLGGSALIVLGAVGIGRSNVPPAGGRGSYGALPPPAPPQPRPAPETAAPPAGVGSIRDQES